MYFNVVFSNFDFELPDLAAKQVAQAKDIRCCLTYARCGHSLAVGYGSSFLQAGMKGVGYT
jgi:hypothetical protein